MVSAGMLAIPAVVISAPRQALGQATPAHAPGSITALAVSPDGKRLAVGGYGQVAVFDTTTWLPIAKRTDVEDNVRSLSFYPDNKYLAVGSGLPGTSGKIFSFDTTGEGKDFAYPGQADTIDSLQISTDGKCMLLGSADKKARFYPGLPQTYGMPIDQHNDRVSAVAISPKPEFLFATGGMDRFVKIWDVKTRTCVANFDRPEAGVTGLVFLPTGNQLIGSSLDGALYWWQLDYDQRQRSWSGNNYRRTRGAHEFGVLALAISATGNRIVTTGADSRVRVWNAGDGARIRDFDSGKEPEYAVAISPDGKVAYSGGRSGLVQVWDVEGNKQLRTFGLPPLPATEADIVKPTQPVKKPEMKKPVATKRGSSKKKSGGAN
jgi:WD40 repeat protein